MIDHVSFGCADLDAAAALYARLLGCLGYEQTRRDPAAAAFGRDGSLVFWLNRVEGAAVAGAGSHVAFAAAAPAQVDALGALARAEGLTIRRPPGRRPDIGPAYYGIVLEDRDGNVIEAVAYD
ncbi:MAG TPA: VOC family protein [Alphaproteobacteria bacterium]|nr:VOC family protein [Alphaproteobacteria bacterium]